MHDLLRRADDQIGRLTRMIADLLDVARIQTDRPGGAAGAVRPGRPGAALVGRGATRLAGSHDRLRGAGPSAPRPGRRGAHRAGACELPDQRPQVFGARPARRGGRAGSWGHGARGGARPGAGPERGAAGGDLGALPAGARCGSPGYGHGLGGGLGLGLYISRTIIAQHGGEVGVESMRGEGRTYRCMLPSAEQPRPAHRGSE